MIGHLALGCLVLGFLILAVDWAVAHLQGWRQRRRREREMRKFAMSPFNAVKRDWWLS